MAHGGDIYTNKVEMDLSVNTNPFPLPVPVRKAMYEALLYERDHYPDQECADMRNALSHALSVDMDQILCGNGSSALLQAAVFALRPRKALLLAPGYTGYTHALKAVGCREEYYFLREDDGFALREDILDRITDQLTLVIISNPNNPTGRMADAGLLERICGKGREMGVTVILDESYLDLRDPGVSAPWKDLRTVLKTYPNLLLLRAFTKSFALPGIRIGYMLSGSRDRLRKIREMMPEWDVSVIAQRAGAACAGVMDKLAEEVPAIQEEKEYLQNEMRKAGFRVYDSDANFFLVRSGRDLYTELLEQKILIRKCDDFAGLGKDYYRISVRTRAESERLLQALLRPAGANLSGEASKDIRKEKDCQRPVIEHVLPADIEANSFRTIAKELELQGRKPDPAQAPVTMRVIHTTADFEYADTMTFSPGAIEEARRLIREGADIVTDTNMALAGINKRELAKYGGEARCFMALPEIAERAKKRGSTRAAACMEMAAEITKPVIFAIGNAPTALIELRRMYDEGIYRPAFIIGMPVGFVNVSAAKELILETDIPCIVNRGRKGGSNAAAAVCNALLYQMRDQ